MKNTRPKQLEFEFMKEVKRKYPTMEEKRDQALITGAAMYAGAITGMAIAYPYESLHIAYKLLTGLMTQ